MIAFWALIIKDLRIFFGDPRAVIMAFAAPILIGSFFGYVFGGMGKVKDTGKVKVLVVDDQPGALTRRLMESLQKEAMLEVASAKLVFAQDEVKKGRIPVAVVFPPGFGDHAAQALFGGSKKPIVRMLYDPSHKMEASMVQGLLTGQVMQAVAGEAFGGPMSQQIAGTALKNLEQSGLDSQEKKSLTELLGSVQRYGSRPQKSTSSGFGLSIPFEMKEEALTARSGTPYNAYAHAFGGMAIQFMLFMGIDVGIGMLLLRQRGLWRRFRAAPLSKLVLLGSRAASAMLVGMLILAVVFAFARVVFGVKIEGSLLGFLGICASFSLMTAAYGLLIAALGKTPEAARGLAILGTLLMVMLSGAWVPSFIFPAWMQTLTKFIPPRWAMDGLDAMVWRGLGLEEALLPIGVLLFSTVVFGTIAVLRFRWDTE